MFSFNEVTGGLLIAVLSASLLLLFFIAWQFIYFARSLRHCIRHVRRLMIAITGIVGKMATMDEVIDEMLSAQGAGLAEGAPLAAASASGTAGGTAARPDAPQGQEEALVQKHRERLAALAAGGRAKQFGLVIHGKACTADQIDALDNSEVERLYARYEARLGAAMTRTLWVCSAPALCSGGIDVSPDPSLEPGRAYC